ncbi:MAG: hypothetical protein IKJ99_03425 [Oscillospiraceae bacterium]|nr:hypothetical protein [Oscillospiraceae bacterium]
MLDIKLDQSGDILVSDTGDVFITQSVRQAVLVRLRWIYNEWRLAPELGFPWFEYVFVKNPNLITIRQLIRDEIMKVDHVTDASVTDVTFNKQKRTITFAYTCTVSEETFREEVTMNV